MGHGLLFTLSITTSERAYWHVASIIFRGPLSPLGRHFDSQGSKKFGESGAGSAQNAWSPCQFEIHYQSGRHIFRFSVSGINVHPENPERGKRHFCDC